LPQRPVKTERLNNPSLLQHLCASFYAILMDRCTDGRNNFPGTTFPAIQRTGLLADTEPSQTSAWCCCLEAAPRSDHRSSLYFNRCRLSVVTGPKTMVWFGCAIHPRNLPGWRLQEWSWNDENLSWIRWNLVGWRLQ